jgi:hypothetical protein
MCKSIALFSERAEVLDNFSLFFALISAAGQTLLFAKGYLYLATKHKPAILALLLFFISSIKELPRQKTKSSRYSLWLMAGFIKGFQVPGTVRLSLSHTTANVVSFEFALNSVCHKE